MVMADLEILQAIERDVKDIRLLLIHKAPELRLPWPEIGEHPFLPKIAEFVHGIRSVLLKEKED